MRFLAKSLTDMFECRITCPFNPYFSMQTTPRKPSSCLDLKNQGKKSAKTGTLGFLRNDCAQGGGDSRKPTKNQGEIQGSRKPSVLVGFLRQKKNCAYPLWMDALTELRHKYLEGFLLASPLPDFCPQQVGGFIHIILRGLLRLKVPSGQIASA